jgi:hypothetical protein
MANKSNPFPFAGGGGSVRSLPNPQGNSGAVGPAWGTTTKKPDGVKLAPSTGGIKTPDTAATPMKDNPAENSTATSGAGAESPNDVGQEEK